MQHIFYNPPYSEWPLLCTRATFETETLENIVGPVLLDVKKHGDKAVKKYALQFDNVELTDLAVSQKDIAEAKQFVDSHLQSAIQLAIKNINQFHIAQAEYTRKIETSPGVLCWRKSVAIQGVGLYIPGGTAPLFSTLMMLAIPALAAGCTNLIVCTPCNEEGKVHPAILYTASILGIQQIYRVGGIQAIGAMAYGTESIPAVDKIFGPGNQYVTCAKQLVNRSGVAIDLPAGPSELAVYADESCNPAFVAADLLSQAEHGPDSQVILVACSEEIITEVNGHLLEQLTLLPRKEIAEASLINSRCILLETVDTAFAFLNQYAPEHLVIASNNAESLAEKVINAGSVFLGNYSPESAGDYASGTNHILPTNGYARSYSGVSLDSFVKKITFQEISQKGIQNIGPAIEAMAAAEGLEAHKKAVTIRLQQIKNNSIT